MAAKSPAKESTADITPSKLPSPSPLPSASTTPPVKTEAPSSTPRPTPPPTPAPEPPVPAPPSSDAELICVPSYSRWFSWNDIHECEVRFLPEFFDSRSPSKNPRLYKYFRDSIIKHFRENPSRKITFTDARRTLVGDVGSIRRVFDFLEAWGLINYSASALNKPLKWDDKDTKTGVASSSPGTGGDARGPAADSSAPNRETVKRFCSGCKSPCSIACFACEKYDLTLCARCYVRGNYRVGVSSSDFTRVEISEEIKSEWTEKETLQLLETVMLYGDNWRKVAQHVGGRSEKDCITHFIKLPFGEEFLGNPDPEEVNNKFNQKKEPNRAERGFGGPSKRMRLTPLADASNPIMAQAAFLSTLSGVKIAEAAAQATVATLSKVNYGASRDTSKSIAQNASQREVDAACSGDTIENKREGASVDSNSLLEKEELNAERAVAEIVEVKLKEIEDRVARFEDLDLQMEKEWKQLEQIKNLLVVDQLTLLLHRSSAKTDEQDENVRT